MNFGRYGFCLTPKSDKRNYEKAVTGYTRQHAPRVIQFLRPRHPQRRNTRQWHLESKALAHVLLVGAQSRDVRVLIVRSRLCGHHQSHRLDSRL